ncbi:CoA transferase [Nocardia sp. NPDC051787]|uniref:CaiB/BaiF CoA transferase family protein n=1 Tax=Nocardia sp. NPDC051787 TaxID=3155415 RepID=UPI003435340A
MSVSGALDNVRVLDFTRILAGPFATMQLADFGAQVTKVERPGTGDDTRGWGPPYDAHGQATYFQAVNRNKDSIVLDLTDERDRARARALAVDVDIVVENFRPGLMAEFGLDYDQLRPANPGLVYCSITGFGRGAGAALPGYDLLIQALGGLMSITGSADGEPQKVGVALVDVLAGLFATTGILTALHHRQITGAGQRVDIDLLSCLLAALVNQASAYTAAGVVPTRMGNQHPSIAPYELLSCADGDLVLAVGNDRQFATLCDELGAPHLPVDPQFATNTARVQHRDKLRAELENRLATKSAADWAAALARVRVPAGTVNDIAGAFELAAQLGLDPIVELTRSDSSKVSLCRNPINLSATPASYRSAPPPLGLP